MTNSKFSRALARAVQTMEPEPRTRVQQAYLHCGGDFDAAPLWLQHVAESASSLVK